MSTSELICPGCQSVLRADVLHSDGALECPFCSAKLPAEWASFVPARDESMSMPMVEVSAEGGAAEPALFALPPAGSKVELVEGTAERAVFYVPAGKRRGGAGILFFSLFWNGLTGVFTMAMFTAWINPAPGQAAPPLYFLIPFMSVFWAVGLGILYWWLKMRFERLFLLLEQERLVIRRILFGRERNREITLGGKAAASLQESYSENDTPVHCIAVEGTDGTIKFGTPLTVAEKDWFVDTINAFLRLSPLREQCPSLPAESSSPPQPAFVTLLPAYEPAPTQPGEIGEILSRVQAVVDQTDPERLRIEFPASSMGVGRWVGVAFLVVFATCWYGFLIGSALMVPAPANAFGLVRHVHLIPFFIAGLMPLGALSFCLAGRLAVDVTPGLIHCRWHVGWLGYSRSLEVTPVTKVAVMVPPSRPDNPRIKQTTTSSLTGKAICLALAGTKFLPLTLTTDRDVNQALAVLINEKLNTWRGTDSAA